MLYWGACAHAAAGQPALALGQLEEAVSRGWRHAWWARHDWNLRAVADRAAFRELLARG
jgi:hypothetical protein